MNKNTKNLIATVCLSALGLLLPLQIVSAGLKIDHELKVEEVVISPPPQANKHGKTYAEWAKLWWTWAFKTPVLLPAGSHPFFNLDDCSSGQDGNVWFLGANFGGESQRSCTVPTGKAFVFPLYNNVYINFAADPTLTDEICEAFKNDTLTALGVVTKTALVDGKPLDKKIIRFEQSPIFSVVMPQPADTQTNILAYFGYTEVEFPGWVASANCDVGWYGYIPPLSVGQHTLEWKVESSLLGLLQDVHYNLTVLPRNK